MMCCEWIGDVVNEFVMICVNEFVISMLWINMKWGKKKKTVGVKNNKKLKEEKKQKKTIVPVGNINQD